MKKLLVLALSVVMLVSLTACGTSDNKKASDGQKNGDMADKKTFTVGFDAEYPPYGYIDDKGNYTGFDLELAQAVCDMEGWELVKTPIEWQSKDMELNNGTIDCIWNGFTMTGHEKDYTWSDPYVNNCQVIVTSEKSGIKKLSDLKDKTVGVQAASAALALLSKGGSQEKLGKTFKKLQEFADYNTAFAELQAGTVEAVAMDVGVANYQLESRGKGFVQVEEVLNSEQYGIGFKLGNTELRDVVNKDVEKLAKNGTVEKLAKKYKIADMICLSGVETTTTKK